MAEEWHTPIDWTANYTVGDGDLDEQISDNMNYLKLHSLEFCITNRSFTYLSKTVPSLIADILEGG